MSVNSRYSRSFKEQAIALVLEGKQPAPSIDDKLPVSQASHPIPKKAVNIKDIAAQKEEENPSKNPSSSPQWPQQKHKQPSETSTETSSIMAKNPSSQSSQPLEK